MDMLEQQPPENKSIENKSPIHMQEQSIGQVMIESGMDNPMMPPINQED